ncbi:MAG: 3-isopropylmalate dehydrogenase [Porticoccaceae bacterium]|nr:3-isopropylmalate dehydrogenase [Porticoccaceae bacterium]
MTSAILVLPGDNIGPEIIDEAVKVLRAVIVKFGLDVEIKFADLGGAAFDKAGEPCPSDTMALAHQSRAILLGAVGGPKWDGLERELRPEQGLLKLRSQLGLFANLRPAIMYPQLCTTSSLKPEIVSGLDILIIRELVGGIYFGEPRGIRVLENGEREGFNTYKYSESEIRRIGRVAFEAALIRGRRLCSVDKSNVLEATALWRETITELASEYPAVELAHMYVDNAAMQLIKEPKQFDVVVTGNMFGDILSDAAAMLTGSIGMLPSASLDKNGRGLYEPCHGSAPDIVGTQKANPLATILSVAMMMRYSFHRTDIADTIELAVNEVLDNGLRTPDIMSDSMTMVTTREIGDAVTARI